MQTVRRKFKHENMSFETKIFGYNVLFPVGKKPFPPQLAVISKILKALRDKENALLESPTGTGKTLAILASTFAWQNDIIKVVKSSSQVVDASLPTSSSAETIQNPESLSVSPKKDIVPKIFFCSRTHSQIHQVINEIRSCHMDYVSEIKMTVLGSRSHFCVNKSAKNPPDGEVKKSVDDACRSLALTRSCRYSHNLVPLSNALEKIAVWDIEDAIQNGEKHRGCPYFASRKLLVTAEYVLAPYNYIIDAGIRRAMKIDLKDAVVIFDEAHNLEDICRDAASAEVSNSILGNTVQQLVRLAESGSPAFKVTTSFCLYFIA